MDKLVKVKGLWNAGYIRATTSKASHTLKRAGMGDKAKEMQDRVSAAKGYDDALQIIMEYVELGSIGRYHGMANINLCIELTVTSIEGESLGDPLRLLLPISKGALVTTTLSIMSLLEHLEFTVVEGVGEWQS